MPEQTKRRYRIAVTFLILLILLLVLVVLNIWLGSFSVPIQEVWSTLIGRGGDGTAQRILWQIRLPRMIAGVVLGGVLALSAFCCRRFSTTRLRGRLCSVSRPARS